jgi:hypothetical protein
VVEVVVPTVAVVAQAVSEAELAFQLPLARTTPLLLALAVMAALLDKILDHQAQIQYLALSPQPEVAVVEKPA